MAMRVAMVCGAVLLAMGSIAPAEGVAVSTDVVKSIKSVLPEGWEVKKVGAEVTVSRVRPVDILPEAAGGTGAEKAKAQAKWITLTLQFGELISQEEYRKQAAGQKGELLRSPTQSVRFTSDLDSAGRFSRQSEEYECRAVQARVLGMFDHYAWSANTNEIHRDLMAHLDNFSLSLVYHGASGEADKDASMSLFLYVKEGADTRSKRAWKTKPLTADSAARLVEALAAAGMLDDLHDVHLDDLIAPKGPTYTITLQGAEMEWYSELGWKKELVRKLDLDHWNPAKQPIHAAIEPIWPALEPLVKQWTGK